MKHKEKCLTLENNRRGFTLVELLAVVVIIGVLAAVAVPAYRHYVVQSRAQEAMTLLPQIHLKEEAYFMEFQQYLSTPNNPEDSKYANMCNGGQAIWNDQLTNWQNIGFRPPNPGTYFQYWVAAGSGAIPTGDTVNCYGQIDTALHFPAGTGNNWFIVCARGDLLNKTCQANNPAMVFGMSSSTSYKRVFSDLKRK